MDSAGQHLATTANRGLRMRLGELTEGLGVRLVTPGAADVRITDITEDSRTAMPGSLFIARSGRKADGRQYVMDAVASGASAVLTEDEGPLTTGNSCPNAAIAVAGDVLAASAKIAERFYGNPSSKLDVVGVTGTNGKTTITWLTWKLLNGAGKRCGLIGTVVIDDGREVARATMTTPPAVDMSWTLANMVEAGCGAVALETSSHALHQHRVGALSFDVGVFTNLTQDHLDYHHTMAEYAAAKARLFAMLPADGAAIVNADDPAHATMIAGTKARVIRCSRVTGAPKGDAGTAQVRIARVTMSGMELELAGPFGALTAKVPLIGAYNAMNVLQAVATAHAMGLTAEELAVGLTEVTAPTGRLERASGPEDDIAAYVDYAHTDDGLRSMLAAVREAMGGDAKKGKLWVAFGCGGDKDKTKRPKMGRAASDLADVVVVTSDNPRSERPGDIISQIIEGIPEADRAKVVVHADRAKAIEHAISRARAGDVVVIAGKGHETEQILPDGQGGTYRIEFDDKRWVDAALMVRRGGTGAAEVKVMLDRNVTSESE